MSTKNNIHRIVLFAGSCNPIHIDHLRILKELKHNGFFNEVITWATNNPLKLDPLDPNYDPLYLPHYIRKEMLNVACDNFFDVDTKIEVNGSYDSPLSGVSLLEFLNANNFDLQNIQTYHSTEFNKPIIRYRKTKCSLPEDFSTLYEVWIAYGQDTINTITTWSSFLSNSIISKFATGFVELPRAESSVSPYVRIVEGLYYGCEMKLVPTIKTNFESTEKDFDAMIDIIKGDNHGKNYYVENNKIRHDIMYLKMEHEESYKPTIIMNIQGLSNISSSIIRYLLNVNYYQRMCDDNDKIKNRGILSDKFNEFKKKKPQDFANLLAMFGVSSFDDLVVFDHHSIISQLNKMLTPVVFDLIQDINFENNLLQKKPLFSFY